MSENSKVVRRAREWVRIALNNLKSGQKVLQAHEWQHDPFAASMDELKNLELQLTHDIERYEGLPLTPRREEHAGVIAETA